MSSTHTVPPAGRAGTAYRQGRRGPGVRAALLTGGAVAAATLLVHVYDPAQEGSYGLCPLRLTTGLLCPFCGGTRAVHALTHGQWDVAMGLNPLVTLALPVAVVLWVLWLVRAWRGRHTDFLDRIGLVWTLIVAIVAFGVLRNVPVLAPFLSPLT
ncbi:DUF2752 domain-containing protein [Ornithinimicrobium sediminis]|uniref:DUF2752 domain-containing protein n=1 Tax=Ornithinimicrobium sediminis TaxID=2904603 RepID=UPI001E5A92F8|nr:DUF2752 domain-containing protein [Ornithinimicrobium sediminis]